MNIIEKSINEHIETVSGLTGIKENIVKLAEKAIKTLKSGNKILIMGNGGSAADSQHMATEIAVRFIKNRKALPAIALTTDTSVITAAANDLSFDEIFSRQIEAIASEDDLVIGISTSGKSRNILRGLETARKQGCATAALLGCGGGSISEHADYPVIVRSDITARIQECHILIIHIICEMIEEEFNES